MSNRKSTGPEERGNPLDAVIGEFHDARGRTACPYAMQVADMLTTFKPHYASRKELDANGGVCKKCAAKIKNSAEARSKRREEVPSKIEPHRNHDAYFDGGPVNHSCFDDRSAQPVETTDFDFDEVDAALSGISKHSKNGRESIFDAFEKIFHWCFSENRINIAAVRFAVIGDNLYPELIGNKSNKELARQLGVSRQVFSKTRKAFKNHFGIRLKSLKPPNRRNKNLTAPQTND